ncbi:MAG: NAD-glutamate dehydrogenase [Alphaproteobacteria bacterium]|nr:NAD-glutamate dehydrogenase [Alphaproteobacteria bacterium]
MPQSLIQKALKKLPANAPEQQKILLKELAGDLRKDDLDQIDDQLLAATALSHWSLLKNVTQNVSDIKIYAPATQNPKFRKTLIDIVSADRAFLVDSVAAEINRNKLLIDFLLHPILHVKYNQKGQPVAISRKPMKGYQRQSHIHIQIKDTISEDDLAELEKSLRKVLEDVYFSNRDWAAMLDKLRETRSDLSNARTRTPKEEVQKYCSFLDYLYNNNFTLLGYREYLFSKDKGESGVRIAKGKGLGILHEDVTPAFICEKDEGLPRHIQPLKRALPPLSVSKTNRLSTVHRQVPMDVIAVATYDKDGNVNGERLFLGLFTSVTYSRSVADIPFLREKVEEVVSLSGFIPASHDAKALRHILEKYPRDELFQISEKELFSTAVSILRLQERQRIALFMRRDVFSRYISCLIYIPRDRFGTTFRKRIGRILEEELQGESLGFTTRLDDSVFARVMFIIRTPPGNGVKYDPARIEKLLQEAGKTWTEQLFDAFSQTLDNIKEVTDISLKYGEAFPSGYTGHYSAKEAVFDIRKIETVLESGQVALDLYRPKDLEPHRFRLKVFHPTVSLTLSDIMPILENMGLRVISELPFEIKPQGADASVWVHDFLLETPDSSEVIHAADVKEIFEDAFAKIWAGKMESDSLNALVLSARMNWQEIIVLRAYVHYLKQLRYPFEQPYIQKALTDHPVLSRLMVNLFKAFHDPRQKEQPENYDKAIRYGLEKVVSLDQDRVLRSLKALINATLRTNFYQRDENGDPKGWLSFKLDCKAVEDMPTPRPYREIFVYSPRVEGVHLRGDRIARGGIRWSDRYEDYRTEILGLMKAQMVKNAVIVPMGAKGGFILRHPPAEREALRKEGIECYRIFIRGLLDLTDNRRGAKITPPPKTVRRDEDDPYLVVAADKGTATFSDIANSLSAEYEFWLGDAFASGGSAGYDHKKMGITAKGGWESVKLHFRQLNHNIQTQPFNVVGVGDMGGDVFGNAMLLSPQIRMIGAFNHIHIFCDPDPDPAVSFEERKRLFENVLGWDHYDLAKLSTGGRIYSRSEKTLQLTPEIQKRFGLANAQVSSSDLIQAMLTAGTDLLWFGGIGTYIKSSRETHADVGDKANDTLRVNASAIRAKVIGEGANLGITQLGRVELAERGVRLNTDFVDNSGGVDCSDHEVNIKILLTEVMQRKTHTLTLNARNKLLESMTGDVAAKVLTDNYQQALAISLAELQAAENLPLHEEFMQDLERETGLDRKLEGLPDSETVALRLRIGKGLTRPELCLLLSHAKTSFARSLLYTDLPDDPDMQSWLVRYFPESLQTRYAEEISHHLLRREIIATVMTNSFVNRMGPTFLKSRMKKTGSGPAAIARAYVNIRAAFGLQTLWSRIEGLDNLVPTHVQLRAMAEISKLTDYAVTWLLMHGGTALTNHPEAFRKNIVQLQKNFERLIPPGLQEKIRTAADSWEKDGFPKDLAQDLALIPVLARACDILRISLENKVDLEDTASVYFDIGETFHMDWLRRQGGFLTSDDPWYSEALNGLIDRLYGCQASMALRVLTEMEKSKGKDKGKKKPRGQTILQSWLEKHPALRDQVILFLTDLRKSGTVDLPILVIAEQRLRSFCCD